MCSTSWCAGNLSIMPELNMWCGRLCHCVCERKQPQWGESCSCGLCFLVNRNSLDRWIVAQAAPEGTEAMMTTNSFWGGFIWRWRCRGAWYDYNMQLVTDSLHVFCAYVRFMIVIPRMPRISFGFEAGGTPGRNSHGCLRGEGDCQVIGEGATGKSRYAKMQPGRKSETWEFFRLSREKPLWSCLVGLPWQIVGLWKEIWCCILRGLVLGTDCTDFIYMCPPEDEPHE